MILTGNQKKSNKYTCPICWKKKIPENCPDQKIGNPVDNMSKNPVTIREYKCININCRHWSNFILTSYEIAHN